MFLAACGGRFAALGDDGGVRASIVVPDAGDPDIEAPTPDATIDGEPAEDAGIAPVEDASIDDASIEAALDALVADASNAEPDAGDGGWIDMCGHKRPDVFADEVIAFDPGPTAGFGQNEMPCVVLGPPEGLGATAGSLDVVSLGDKGSIILKFDDVDLVDQPGPDLVVFENPIPGFVEPGLVAVSEDGGDWYEWPCQPQNADAGYPYCAGIHPVYSNSNNGISPTDVDAAGGDDFDLASLGVTRARYVRIRDSGFSHYGGDTGGFDLDAIAAVHSTPNGN